MKIHSLAILWMLLFSCSTKTETHTTQEKPATEQHITKTAFQSILDKANLQGAILIYDAQTDLYYSNDFEWSKQGQLPVSTFKIPNSIIALETGVVENERTLFKWNGEKRAFKRWEQDLIFKDAFHLSCVPCYQEVARDIGLDRMQDYLKKLNYGNIQVDAATIDNFWLEGESRISQFQQIDFLKRLYQSALPISERTDSLMKDIMVIEETEVYKLSGKTGWSNNNGRHNGWYVGYIESKNMVYYFATNVAPKEQFNMELFARMRIEVTNEALKEMGIIQ